jgi:hypothetical protein
LCGQKKYSQAEPLLLSGYDGMQRRLKKIPAIGRRRVTEAAKRLAQYYAATGQADKAAKWQQTLKELEEVSFENQDIHVGP